jgi:hypothetical protein
MEGRTIFISPGARKAYLARGIRTIDGITLDANQPGKRPCMLTLADLEKLLGDSPVVSVAEANRREYEALAELNKKNENFWRSRK